MMVNTRPTVKPMRTDSEMNETMNPRRKGPASNPCQVGHDRPGGSANQIATVITCSEGRTSSLPTTRRSPVNGATIKMPGAACGGVEHERKHRRVQPDDRRPRRWWRRRTPRAQHQGEAGCTISSHTASD